MTRREVLRLTAAMGVAVLGSAGCAGEPGSGSRARASETPRAFGQSSASSPRRELAAVTAVPDGGALDVSTAAGQPAYLIRSADSIRALSAICTHAQCTVAWAASSREFQCPCHHGTYDQRGTVIGGPPPRGLTELPVVVDDGIVYLDA